MLLFQYIELNVTLLLLYVTQLHPSTCKLPDSDIQLLYCFKYFYVGVPAVAALLQLIILPFCPESPPWLYITKSRVADASKALKTFRGAGGSIESELAAYSEEKIEQDNREKVLL